VSGAGAIVANGNERLLAASSPPLPTQLDVVKLLVDGQAALLSAVTAQIAHGFGVTAIRPRQQIRIPTSSTESATPSGYAHGVHPLPIATELYSCSTY
jgi:hypothetical protein